MDEFEEQLHLQKLAEQKTDDGSNELTRTDPDGTVYVWDSKQKAWFPRVSILLWNIFIV